MADIRRWGPALSAAILTAVVSAGVAAGPADGSAAPPAAAANALDLAISGSAAGPLLPGRRRPIDLTFWNPQPHPIRVVAVSVEVTGVVVDQPGCPGAADFSVSGFTGDYRGLVIPPGGRASLSGLGVDSTRWPRVWLHRRPVALVVKHGGRGDPRDGGRDGARPATAPVPDHLACPDTRPVLTFTGTAIKSP